jgi:hypothetical protein
MIFHFNSGFLSIAFKAQAISCHSQIQAHNQANQIANQAQIEAINQIDSAQSS